MITARRPRPGLWTGAAATLIFLLAYMLLWWNRGIQLNSNGMPTVAAQMILDGKLPYRDFHFWCPPGHLLVYTALTALFGDGLIYVRIFAVAERMAIFLTAYFWLCRMFAPRWVFFGVVAAGVGFSSDFCDVIAHYDYDSLLAALLAGYAASAATGATGGRKYALCAAAGLFTGVCLVCKQTLGVGLFPVFPVIFFFAFQGSARLLGSAFYLLGWLAPLAPVSWWLWRGGAWPAFVNLVFLQGTSSKGSLFTIVFRPVIMLGISRMLLAAFVLALLTLAAYAWSLRRERNAGEPPVNTLWKLAALCAAALLAGMAYAWSPAIGQSSSGQMKALTAFSDYCIFLSFIGSGALAVLYTVRGISGHREAGEAEKWTLASVSFVTAYMFSLSWAAFEPMLVPGLAFLLAFALDRYARLRVGRARTAALLVLGLALITTASIRKFTWPYQWHNWNDPPVKFETAATEFPELRGIRVAPETAAFLSRVTNLIQGHSRPEDSIFCFPNYTLFYVIAHRAPATFALMHWFDITPDYIARQDAERMRRNRPAVILMVDMPEDELRQNEIWFRGGAGSGQRDLMAAIPSMPGYRLVETVPIPHVDYPLRVYARE